MSLSTAARTRVDLTVRGLLPHFFARRPATDARLAATAGATEDARAKDMTCTTTDVSGVT